MFVGSAGAPAVGLVSVWNCPWPPETFGGHANPVLESVPVRSCQQPLPQQPYGRPTARLPSKPDQKSRLDGSVAGALGALGVAAAVLPVVTLPPLAAMLTALMLKYCASATTFRTCLPALSGTALLPNHWYVVQSPVIGTGTVPVTLLPSTSMWKAVGAA